ncbi:hypothetical protein A2U01_0088292, partial [Trifolium medium]|nr:hypothetical protein [Trifolium medium]
LASSFLPMSGLNENDSRLLNSVWFSSAPTKVIIFNWQLLRLRLPMRLNLMHRCSSSAAPT